MALEEWTLNGSIGLMNWSKEREELSLNRHLLTMLYFLGKIGGNSRNNTDLVGGKGSLCFLLCP